jgi:transposase
MDVAAQMGRRRMALFTRKLTMDEWAELEELMQQPEGDIPLQRLMIVLLSAQGYRVQDVSREVDLHPINVRKWIHRFNEDSIDGLRSGKSPGRPLVFSADQREQIVNVATTDPRQLGLNFTRWSLQRLRKYLIQHTVVEQISVETVRQVLRAHGIRHRASGGWPASTNGGFNGRFTKQGLKYESSYQLGRYRQPAPNIAPGNFIGHS